MADEAAQMQVEFLYRALTEAQGIVNFTDTKAGAVIVLVGGFLAFIGDIHAQASSPFLRILVALSSASMLGAATCAIWALTPQLNPGRFVELGGDGPPDLFYLRRSAPISAWRTWLPLGPTRKMAITLADLTDAVGRLGAEDIQRCLAYELLKVSFIREEKSLQVNRATRLILIAGVFLVILVVSAPI